LRYIDPASGEVIEEPDPDEIVCASCGRAVDAHQEYTEEELIRLLPTDRKLKGEFLTTKDVGDKIAAGDSEVPQFVDRCVGKVLTMERTFEVEVAYVALSFLETKYEVSLAASRVKTCEAYNLKGQIFPALCLARSDVPKDWPFLPGTVKFKESCKFEETRLPAQKQLRDEHAINAFSKLMTAIGENKCTDVESDRFGNLQTAAKVLEKITKTISVRNEKSVNIQAEMDALKSGTDHVKHIVKVSNRQRNASAQDVPVTAPHGLEDGTHPKKRPGKALARSRSGSRLHGRRDPRSAGKFARGRGGQKSRGRSSDGSLSKIFRGSKQARVPESPARQVAPSQPEASTPIAKVVGGYYKHKEFDFVEIMNGAKPTRQTDPATMQ
jgi:hypothetical protein